MEIYSWKILCVVCVLLLNAAGSLSQLDECGRAPLNTKIVGGGNAASGSWPWQVSIQSSGFHFCGGSLINQSWVLSAAHCFQSHLEDVTVNLGMTALQGINPNKQQKRVNIMINHPKYNSKNNDNDIALLQLKSPVTFTDYVMPVCLAAAKSDFPATTKVWVTGWGDIRSDMSLPYPETLQEVQLPIVSNTECTKSYDSNTITKNMICAGLAEGGKDSCQGDSGGPMVVKVNGAWVQAGIVSFGHGCALPNYPGVYTRVSQYEDWIYSVINSSQSGLVKFSNLNRLFLFLSSFIIPFLPSLSII